MTRSPLVFVLLLVPLLLHGARAEELRVDPYLQSLSSDGVTICWQTEGRCRGSVRYGIDRRDLDQSVALRAPTRTHFVRLDGLKPGTKYYYAVEADGQVLLGDASTFFQTAPKPGSNMPVRIWAAGDVGTGDSEQAAVRDALLRAAEGRPIDFFLGLGDLAYDRGESDEFRDNFFAPYREILRQVCVFPCIGNHETYGDREDWGDGRQFSYFNYFALPQAPSGTESYYSFDYADVHVISLDSQVSDRSRGGAMATWLQADLSASKARWLIATFHHPPYTKGSHDSDEGSSHIEMRENILPILEAYGVDLVLSGHSHLYERSMLVAGAHDTPTTTGRGRFLIDQGDGSFLGTGVYTKPAEPSRRAGAVFVVTGNGGKVSDVQDDYPHVLMRHSETELGSCLIDIVGDQLTLRHIRADGTISDRFTIHKGRDRQPPAVLASLLRAEDEIELQLSEPIPVEAATPEHFEVDGTAVQAVRLLTDQQTLVLQTGSLERGVEHRLVVRKLPDLVDNRLKKQELRFRVPLRPQTLVAEGATWRYLPGSQDPGADWILPDFDASSWREGASGFGYGDGDDETVLSGMEDHYTTVFTRHSFELTTGFDAAWLEVAYDDGFAAWLNGKRVAGANAPASIGPHSRATGRHEAASERFVISAALLQPGRNVLAVVGLNRSKDSSDLSLRVALHARPEAEE